MVNGIENQIVINRTTEYAKQTADRINQTENAKAFAAHIEKEKAERESHSVLETEHPEYNRIRRDKDRDAQTGEGSRQEESLQDEAQEEETLTVMPSDTLGKEIDITV